MDKLEQLKYEIYNHLEYMKQKEFRGQIGNSVYVKGYLNALEDVIRSIKEIEYERSIAKRETL